MDGSSKFFMEALEKGGIEKQEADVVEYERAEVLKRKFLAFSLYKIRFRLYEIDFRKGKSCFVKAKSQKFSGSLRSHTIFHL